MDRNFELGAVASPPTPPATPSIGYPTRGNPGIGLGTTKPGAWWYHMITEEIRAAIVGLGGTPDRTVVNQLWLQLEAVLATKGEPIDSGTRMSFNQTAAPTGWTKDTTAALNDSIMRIVTGAVGSGGSTAFSTFNGQSSVGATTLSSAQIPAHSHVVTDPGHTHTMSVGSVVVFTGGGTGLGITTPGSNNVSSGSVPVSAATGISLQNTGGSGSHSHSMTTDIKYRDFIIASKD